MNKLFNKQSKLAPQQATRLQRLSMSVASYLVTLSILSFCAWLDLVAWQIPFHFFVSLVVINAVFFYLIYNGYNLRCKDHSMTAAQMIVSLVPTLYSVYFLDLGQARASFLVVAIVPLLYGMLALTTRTFLKIGILFIALYILMILLINKNRPDSINPTMEVLQAFALIVVVIQITIIGGYISGLRSKLRYRNKELNIALVKISDMANRDELTGIANRRKIFEVLDTEVKRKREPNTAIGICILDVDHFKRINDTYGHQVGDEVLKRIAEEVPKSLRTMDCFGRYGGEEFLLILPSTSLEGTEIKANRLREDVAKLEFKNLPPGEKVTISIGIAVYFPEEEIDATIQRADKALYEAKAHGRNRCVAHPFP